MTNIKSEREQKSTPIDFVIIGRVIKPHGIHGAISVFPMTDDPERFSLLKSVFVGDGESKRFSFDVENIVIRNRDVIVKLHGVNTRDQAESLRGSFFEIRRKECMPLEDDAHYIFELVGMEVKTVDNQSIGTIVDVIDYPANDVYVVESEKGEILIPVIHDVVKSIDKSQGIVTIAPIEGLLE